MPGRAPRSRRWTGRHRRHEQRAFITRQTLQPGFCRSSHPEFVTRKWRNGNCMPLHSGMTAQQLESIAATSSKSTGPLVQRFSSAPHLKAGSHPLVFRFDVTAAQAFPFFQADQRWLETSCACGRSRSRRIWRSRFSGTRDQDTLKSPAVPLLVEAQQHPAAAMNRFRHRPLRCPRNRSMRSRISAAALFRERNRQDFFAGYPVSSPANERWATPGSWRSRTRHTKVQWSGSDVTALALCLFWNPGGGSRGIIPPSTARSQPPPRMPRWR